MPERRTDLAVEAKEIWAQGERAGTLTGVVSQDKTRDGFAVTTVRITDERGAAALGKPVGTYVTVELDRFIYREDDAFELGARALAAELTALLGAGARESVLVVGLGNKAITADAIGPATVRSTMVTSHLVDRLPETFGTLRRVYALEAGVMGTTGIESARLVRAVSESIRPDRVLVVDALASRSLKRICRTVQLADTGIVPGSGVNNAREGLNSETLGVPVIAVGVPTVVDAGTLAADIVERAGATGIDLAELESFGEGLIVTPKEIDGNVGDISKLVGYAINMALHPDLTLNDITMFLG
ncbi:MAG: GPR endopeptidase [Oscillospiraceae bacterium]|jgi:spore protease|nr:GPR endopeptidase [Oscillospiraceae bacterium]